MQWKLAGTISNNVVLVAQPCEDADRCCAAHHGSQTE